MVRALLAGVLDAVTMEHAAFATPMRAFAHLAPSAPSTSCSHCGHRSDCCACSPASTFCPRTPLHAPSRGVHISSTAGKGSKLQPRPDVPQGWKWSQSQQEDTAKYNAERADYRAQLTELRKQWRPLVDKHEELLAKLKARADAERLAQQEADLERQYARWKRPQVVKTSRDHWRPNVVLRQEGYLKRKMQQELLQAARAHQVQTLLNDSRWWMSPDSVDDAIYEALDKPESLYGDMEPWGPGDRPGKRSYAADSHTDGFENDGIFGWVDAGEDERIELGEVEADTKP